MATYYVKVDTYWQNSPDYFVGPFSSRSAASAWLEASDGTLSEWGRMTSDVKNNWRGLVVSKTEAKKYGMESYSESTPMGNIPPPSIAPSAEAIEGAVHALEM